MALVTKSVAAPAVPRPALTAKQAWADLQRKMNQIYDMLERHHGDAFKFLYAQPDPLAVIKESGKDAKTLFEVSRNIQETLKKANPNYVIQNSPVEVEFNEDGSLKEQPVV